MLKPVRDKIFIQKIKNSDQKTESGIMVQQAYQKVIRCRVLAIGSGKEIAGKVEPLCCKEGEEIAVHGYAYQPLTVLLNGELTEYAVIRDDDVLGIFNG